MWAQTKQEKPFGKGALSAQVTFTSNIAKQIKNGIIVRFGIMLNLLFYQVLPFCSVAHHGNGSGS